MKKNKYEIDSKLKQVKNQLLSFYEIDWESSLEDQGTEKEISTGPNCLGH